MISKSPRPRPGDKIESYGMKCSPRLKKILMRRGPDWVRAALFAADANEKKGGRSA